MVIISSVRVEGRPELGNERFELCHHSSYPLDEARELSQRLALEFAVVVSTTAAVESTHCRYPGPRVANPLRG